MKITTVAIAAAMLVAGAVSATPDPAHPVASERDSKRFSIEVEDNTWGLYTIWSSRPATLSQFLGDVLSVDEYGTRWAAFTYRDGAYVQPGVYDVIDPLEGFWLLQLTGAPITIEFEGEVQLAVDRRILEPRWNIVGGGSAETMKATTDGFVQFFAYDAESGGYVEEDGARLPPSVGYWAYTRSGDRIYGQRTSQ